MLALGQKIVIQSNPVRIATIIFSHNYFYIAIDDSYQKDIYRISPTLKLSIKLTDCETFSCHIYKEAKYVPYNYESLSSEFKINNNLLFKKKGTDLIVKLVGVSQTSVYLGNLYLAYGQFFDEYTKLDGSPAGTEV